MAKRNSKNFNIKPEVSAAPDPIDASRIDTPKDEKCGVNFRYYQQRHQCLSDWQKGEIKQLSKWLVKQSKKTVTQIQSVTKTCHAHKGKKCKLPADVSPDVRLYGLDVTAGGRVHGFFAGNTFYLLWLDRNHEIHD